MAKSSADYAIAEEGGYFGHDPSALHAEVRLEFNGVSPDDFTRIKREILFFLGELYKQTFEEEFESPVCFVMTDCVVTYVSITDNRLVNGNDNAIILSADRSPLHHSMTDAAWKWRVKFYAKALGTRFRQFRIHTTYTHRELEILQNETLPDVTHQKDGPKDEVDLDAEATRSATAGNGGIADVITLCG